jgi:hypothetical protein
MSRLNLVLLTMVVLATACYKDDSSSGPTNRKPMANVLLTDGPFSFDTLAPFPFDTVQSVNVYVISVAVSTEPDTGSNPDAMNWVTVTEPHRQINLLELQQGDTALLGSGEITAGQYRAVRLILDGDSSSIRFQDGSTAQVQWGGVGPQAIHAFVEAAVAVPAQGVDIVIDFDVGRSFQYNVFGDGAFRFLPWIRAVNRAETGDIAGTVMRDTSGGGTAGPVKNATVRAWGGGPAWYIYSTGATDATGHYRLAYLLPGTYAITVDGPSSSLGAALDSNVAVNRGLETTHDVTLSAFRGSVLISGTSVILTGRGDTLQAVVVDAQHHPDTSAVVAWQNLDPAVLNLQPDMPTPRHAVVTASTPGTARVVATSGALADTLVITIVADSTP